MKYLKIGISTFLVGVTAFLALGCGSGEPTTAANSIATVRRGNISIQVTGTGNLALSTSQDLAFEVAGTVSQILVEPSDSVKKGQSLARLDTSARDAQIQTLENAVDTAQQNANTAANNLTKAQRQVATNQMAVSQKQLDLKSAQNAVLALADVKAARALVDEDTLDLDFARSMQKQAADGANAGADLSFWNMRVKDLQQALDRDQKALDDILNGVSTAITLNSALQISQAQFAVRQAEKNLADAETAVADAQAAIAEVQSLKDQADQAVADAQSTLDEARGLSTEITSPIDGFVTKINVKGGDEVQKGTVAMQIADPTQFESNILVSERDIFSVKVGGDATVSVDALSGLSFPAKITAIAPLATVQQGVVNYEVTVQLTSLKPVLPSQIITGSGQKPLQIITGTPAPGSSPVPAPSGAPSQGDTFTFGSGAASPGAMAVQDMSLKDGLSATVNILVQQQDNVLLVPNRAISRQGKNQTVKLVKGTSTEQVTVQTGLSDSMNTEVISGLNEGDQVSLPTSSSSSSTSGLSMGQAVPAAPMGGGNMQYQVIEK